VIDKSSARLARLFNQQQLSHSPKTKHIVYDNRRTTIVIISTKIDLVAVKVIARAGAFVMHHSHINSVLVHSLPLLDVLAVAATLKTFISPNRRGIFTTSASNSFAGTTNFCLRPLWTRKLLRLLAQQGAPVRLEDAVFGY
jgi:hypothetical protein